jgi:hypothetical protein
MKIRTLLLESTAALTVIGVAQAQAADKVVKPAPVNYVQVCDAYGIGYFIIPGQKDVCLRIQGQIQFQIDRLREIVEKQFDVRAMSRVLTFRHCDMRAKDTALSRIIRAFLRPVDLPALRINGDPNAPFSGVAAGPSITFARIHEGFDFCTVEVRAHDSHPLAIAPIEFPVLLIEMELLRRERAPLERSSCDSDRRDLRVRWSRRFGSEHPCWFSRGVEPESRRHHLGLASGDDDLRRPSASPETAGIGKK